MRWLVGALLATASCGAFGTTPSPTTSTTDGGTNADAGFASDAASADAGTSTLPNGCVPQCNGGGCIEYVFTGTCPPQDWYFGGTGGLKKCEGGAIHLTAVDTEDATATLQVRGPPALLGAHIELRFKLAKWATANAQPGIVFAAGSTDANSIAITAIENGQRNFNLALCHAQKSGLTNCFAFATIAPNTDHVLALDWNGVIVAATLDCTTTRQHPATPLLGTEDLYLSFGMIDGAPIDGTIRDVKLTFR